MSQIENQNTSKPSSKNTPRTWTGKVVAVTGTTSGTGYICARELAKLGATVLLLNRESSRSSAAVEKLKSEVPGGKFEAVTCDLQDFASVRAAASAIAAKHDRVDVLCNNAGVMALPDQAHQGRVRRANADQQHLALFADQRAASAAEKK